MTDGASDGRMHIGHGAGDDAGGKSRGVQFMIGMEDQRHVERAGGRWNGFGAVEHPEKIGSVIQRRIGLDDGLALADAVVAGDQHRQLRGQSERFADVRIVIDGRFVRVVGAERGNRSAQDFHGRGGLRDRAKQVVDF
jgi:hypothetical protein